MTESYMLTNHAKDFIYCRKLPFAASWLILTHLTFIYGKTLEYMTDALESTPAGVYGGGCSLDDFALGLSMQTGNLFL